MAEPLMILCDTNILIEFYKNNAEILAALKQIGQPDIGISVVTQAELYYGALNKRELQQIQKHLTTITIVPLDVAISSEFASLMEQYSLSHKLSIPDALIAATALSHSGSLFTLNRKDFRYIPGLTLYKPPPSAE